MFTTNFAKVLQFVHVAGKVHVPAGASAARQREHHPAGHAGRVRRREGQHVICNAREREGKW